MLPKLKIVSFSDLFSQNVLFLTLNNEQSQLRVHNNIIILHGKCNIQVNTNRRPDNMTSKTKIYMAPK